MAKSFESTPWLLISNLYQQLLQLNPNPFVELNYAIVLYYSGKKIKALEILNGLLQRPLLNQYYLLNAALGKIQSLEGNYEKANYFFLKAMLPTNVVAEKEYIGKMMMKIY